MSQLGTNPRSLDLGSAETLPLGIDFTAYLSGAETVNGNGAPTATLADLTDGSSTAGMLSGSPSANGNTILQTVTGLRAGHRYRLEVVIRPAVGKVWAAELEINCPR